MALRATHSKSLSENARLAKNERIKATSKATRERRKTMIVQVREIKLTSNQMTRQQMNDLQRLFLEAKWLRNSALAAQRFDDAYAAEIGGSVFVRLPGDVMEERPFLVLGGQMKQAVMAELRDNLNALKAMKGKGRRVGRLKFSREVASVNLKQFGGTHKIDMVAGRVKIANVHGWIKARGLKQLESVDEIANAKVVQRANGFFLLLTTYTATRPDLGRSTQSFQPGTSVGIDMGLTTHLTLSTGRKVSAMFEETDRLKRLRRKLARQQKGSANFRKTKRLIRVESARITRRKDDCANKLVHEILKNEQVHIQDENISSWKTRSGFIRGGKRVQASILGRVKQHLVNHPRVTVVGRWQPTTARCVCGTSTKHDVSRRIFTCPACGYTKDRDVHAAENMIRFGEAILSARPERTRTPVEIGVRPAASMNFTFLEMTGSQSMKQEAATSLGSP